MKKIKGTGNDLYGSSRLKLALVVKDILNIYKIDWFIENGTLLGAYRDGLFLMQDDDFDIGVIFEDDYLAKIKALQSFININLPEKYQCREVATYTNKLEIFDPSEGVYTLPTYYNGADFHYVTVDIQVYTRNKNNDLYSLHKFFSNDFFSTENILPTKTITLEGEVFNCPNQTQIFLEKKYGFIGCNAQFDDKTQKYIEKA